ncbi:ankyrin repeat protein [Plakobranchus ocellatus]|uniref:Ankyrin repeat protein n=1 Tax=Plakobranchus ocellatus TaxID=259542 RepID=A0AAV3Z5K8_9GAST|nr:ankyrin repeat protein [Plakobranchus ocellatus]
MTRLTPFIDAICLGPDLRNRKALARNLNELLAAVQNQDLPEVDRLLNLKEQCVSYRIPRVDLGKALPDACRTGLKSLVVKWIVSGANLDPETCQTLLKPAIASGSIESVEALLNRGCDLNFPCSCRHTVLVVAIAFLEKPDDMKMVTFLVEKGANVNRSIGDYSPLLLASIKQSDIVPYLLKNGADVNEVGDELGNTPLTAALYYDECRSSTRCCSIVETLLSAGADPTNTNYYCETALHLAADTEITSLLIQAGADLEARNYLGRTPLLQAAHKGKTDVIHVLKNYGADMAAVDCLGNSAMHIMVTSDEPQEETLRLFEFQCNKINKHGMTPLMLAAQICCENAVRILLELGADPNIVNCGSGEPHTALSLVLGGGDRKRNSSDLACAEELITHNSVTSLPRCYLYFFNMISRDQRRLVQLMVTHGMASQCENTRTIKQNRDIMRWIFCDIPDELSPMALALVLNKLAIAQYLNENWFLTPADLVGSLKLRNLRRLLKKGFRTTHGLRFMNKYLSQPMSLLKLSFVAVSAQLGGVAGREERVSQTPLPNILKDKLLFRQENFPMDFTDQYTDDEFENSSDDYSNSDQTTESDGDY